MTLLFGALLCWGGWHSREHYFGVGGKRVRCRRCGEILWREEEKRR